MSIDIRAQRLTRRIAELYATDEQFAAARPSEAITAAMERPGLRLAEMVRTVVEGYADRPALAQRDFRFVTDSETRRTSLKLLPRFETISYGQLWDRVVAVASALAGDLVWPGDRVCVLGLTGVDYTTMDMALVEAGAVSVPLQSSAPVAQLRPIVAETQPAVIAAGSDFLAEAVELVLTGHAPARLVVLDYRPQVDDHSEGLAAARSRLAEAGSPVVVEPLAALLARGKALPPAQPFVANDCALTMLLYPSGSTGEPKGAMYPERLVANFWRKSTRAARGEPSDHPSITLSFMPMSHSLGRSELYGTLGNGGTVYFAGKSDLSTLLDDLALVRPTQLNFVPRIWELLFQEFQREVGRRSSRGADRSRVEAVVMAEQRQHLLGGRLVSAVMGCAPIPAAMKVFVESYLDLHLVESFGATEDGAVLFDGQVRRLR